MQKMSEKHFAKIVADIKMPADFDVTHNRRKLNIDMQK